MDDIPLSERMFRTMVVVEDIKPEEGKVKVFIPGFNPRKTFWTEAVDFPVGAIHKYYFAVVNLGAARSNDIRIRNWILWNEAS